MHIAKSNVSRLIAIAAAALLATAGVHAQSATGTLGVTATVTSSLQLLFNTGAGGPLLTNPLTSAATLPLGSISAYGTEPSGVTLVTASDSTHAPCTAGSPCFVVSAPVSVVVNQFNGSSTKFTLTAQLATADTADFWAVGAETNAVTSGGATTIISSSGTYGSGGNNESIYLGVPLSAGSGNINNTIDFTVTAN